MEKKSLRRPKYSMTEVVEPEEEKEEEDLRMRSHPSHTPNIVCNLKLICS
jgi:hypothetical protein